MARIFISYSRRDAAFAQRLAGDLEQLGADVWLDVDDIPAGMKWSTAIQTGLDTCDVMLVIVSPDSMASTNVEDEWQYFLDRDHPLIPVLWQPAKIHFQLSRIQYVDFHAQEYAAAFSQLREELFAKGIALASPGDPDSTVEVPQVKPAPATPAAAPPPTSLAPRVAHAPPMRRYGWAVIAVVAVILVIGLGLVLGGVFDGDNVATTDESPPAKTALASGSTATASDMPVVSTQTPTEQLTEVATTISSPTSMPTTTETPTPVATDTPTATATNTLTHTPAATATATLTPTATLTLTPTATATATLTPTATATLTPSYTPTATATPQPDSEQIAFVSDEDGDADIFVMDVDGSDVYRLTSNEVYDGHPAWSPDSYWVAFESDQAGARDIWVMDAFGNGLRALTTDPAADTSPAWSPDGVWIAFVSERDGQRDIYVMDRMGGTPRRLTDGSADDYDPAWSPDGVWIAFVSERDGNPEIYTMANDGSNPVRVTDHSARDLDPAWSPDGSEIVFQSDRNGDDELYVMAQDGDNVRRQTTDSARDGHPIWSNDGRVIAFDSARDGADAIFLVQPVDETLVKLDAGVGNCHSPAWRPPPPPDDPMVAAQPAAAADPMLCTLYTTKDRVPVHIGPGDNRGIYNYLPPGEVVDVIGWIELDEEERWWRIDIWDLEHAWIADEDIVLSGDCDRVEESDPPPLVIIIPEDSDEEPASGHETAGQQGTDGSQGQSDSGGDTGGPQPPPPSVVCYNISATVNDPSRGSASIQTTPNCPGGFTAGTAVSVGASANEQFALLEWKGCGASGNPNPVTITANGNCTITAIFEWYLE